MLWLQIQVDENTVGHSMAVHSLGGHFSDWGPEHKGHKKVIVALKKSS